MLLSFSDSEFRETGFEGIHLLVCKNSHGFFFFFNQFVFSYVIWLGAILSKIYLFFPTTIRAIDTRKMKKQKWNLRVVSSFSFSPIVS